MWIQKNFHFIFYYKSYFFFFIYIFNFLKYNEVGKYNLSQIICLILIYTLLFIGVGSSSLLFQKVLLEFNQRFSEYIEEKQNREFLGSLNEDGYRNDSKNLFSFYLITFGTFFGYYLFWIINYNSYAIQILEENRINNYYENFTNITNNIDINLNTSRINDIYSKNKEIFFFLFN